MRRAQIIRAGFLLTWIWIVSWGASAHGQALPRLSVSDVTVSEANCGSQVATFTISVNAPFGKNATVRYSTADGSAIAGSDYTAATGTLSFPRGSKAPQMVSVPVADILIPGASKAFFLILSNPVNATLAKSQGSATIVAPSAAKCASCGVSCSSGDACSPSVCNAKLGCVRVNASATSKPFCQLAGEGIYAATGPDPNFLACGSSGKGEWVDSDGDGLSDAEERQGYIDLNANGVYDEGVDVPLNIDGPPDPNKPDIYLHYDYFFSDGSCAPAGVPPYVHDHNPPADAIAMVKAAFAAHGVNLHVDPRHDAIPECGIGGALVTTNLTSGPGGNWTINPACGGDAGTGGVVSMHALKQTHLGAGALLNPAFHYMVFSHYSTCPDQQHCNACPIASESSCGGGQLLAGSLGDAEVFGDDIIVSLGSDMDFPQPDQPVVALETWAALTMHELGHNLGLLHGGAGDCTNQKPNYLSVMNYSFFGSGLFLEDHPGASTYKKCSADVDCGGAPYHCSQQTDTSDLSQCGDGANPATCPHFCYHVDYSDQLFNALNQNHLDETLGLQGAPGSKDLTFYYWAGGTHSGFAPSDGTPIDWNGDGLLNADVCGDISDNEPVAACGTLPTLQPSSDWLSHVSGSATVMDNLQLRYQCTVNYFK